MLRLLVLSLLAAFAAAASVSMPVRREMTEQADSTAGWWGALQTNEAYCGLRNFPPIPNGYGIARILCGGHVGVYDHYWMWRITKTNSSEEATVSTEADTYPPSVFKTGEKLYLSIFVPMKPWCGLSKGGQAKCGYGSDEASPFYLESVAKPGVDGIDIDIAADPFYLKTEVGGYCNIVGSGNSAYIWCNKQFKNNETTTWQMPQSTWYDVTIASVSATENNDEEDVYCGFNFIPLNNDVSAVNCTAIPPAIESNYPTMVFAALEEPWNAPSPAMLVSGQTMSFKAHDSLYKYQVSVWGLGKGTNKVVSIDNDTKQPSQWFKVDLVDGEEGDPFGKEQVVTLWNKAVEMYCGVSASSQIVCDKESVDTDEDAAYLFKFGVTFV